MANVAIAGDTSGSVTLYAPPVSGSTVLTLPTSTGTVALTSQAILQVVSTITGAVATGTTTIPADDTIPQNTEGDQYMSLSITPKSATSKLLITVTWLGAIGGYPGSIFVCLFQDSTANALATASYSPPGANYFSGLTFSYVMTSGTTSSTTFKVRAGSQTAGTTTFNGVSSARYFGGSQASSIVITEIGT